MFQSRYTRLFFLFSLFCSLFSTSTAVALIQTDIRIQKSYKIKSLNEELTRNKFFFVFRLLWALICCWKRRVMNKSLQCLLLFKWLTHAVDLYVEVNFEERKYINRIDTQVNNRGSRGRNKFLLLYIFYWLLAYHYWVLGGFHNYCFQNKRQQSAEREKLNKK